MADSKISDLNALTTIAPEDAFPVVDNDVAETKKIAWSNLTKDEDDMSSDSNSHWPTQQSVKAYVDNKYAFSAYMSAAQSVADATTAIVGYDTEVFDHGGNFNTSTYTFTAPVAGIYYFTVRNYIQQLAAGSFFQLYLTTTTSDAHYFRKYNVGAGANYIYIVGSSLMSCPANAGIYIRAYHNHGSARDIGDAYGIRFTEFSGFLVQRL